MPTFNYKATNANKQIVVGTVSAGTESEAAEALRKQNLAPMTVKLRKTKSGVMGNLPDVERITFCRYMSTILTTGLPLTEAIPVLKEETNQPLMRQILDDMVLHLERGQTISAALANYPKAFNKFFLTLVRSGEVSGTMEKSFKYLEQQLRAEYTLSQKIKSALMYPAIVVIAMLGIAFLMFFFILPQIGTVFLTMKVKLNALTVLMFKISLAAAAIRLQLIAGIMIGLLAIAIFFRQPVGKRMLLKLIGPLPVISQLLQKRDLARFSRIFSTLVTSAVPITEALDIALSSLAHPKYRKLGPTLIADVTNGKSVSAAFSSRKAFPALLTQMLAAGEKSGTLDTSLADLAQFYEEEVAESVKKATELLEPLLMLIVGVGVGGIILAIITPLYSVVGSLQDIR